MGWWAIFGRRPLCGWVKSAVPPRCKNPDRDKFPRCVPPRPRLVRCVSAPAPPLRVPRAVCFVHTEGTKVPSLTRNEYTSKHATGRKRYRPVPTVAHRWAWLGWVSPLAEQGRVRGSRSHFHAAMRVWVAVLSFFVKGRESRFVPCLDCIAYHHCIDMYRRVVC